MSGIGMFGQGTGYGWKEVRSDRVTTDGGGGDQTLGPKAGMEFQRLGKASSL